MRFTMGALCSLAALTSCLPQPHAPATRRDTTQADSTAILTLARDLASDARRGRGPWTAENAAAARLLAENLQRLGARPLIGNSLLVPFVTSRRPNDTSYNVVGVLPARDGSIDGELIGITGHLDHLGVGRPDATGDSIYNGFFDDALPVSVVVDLARRYTRFPGDRALLVFFANLEEQGLLGAKALVDRPDMAIVLPRIRLMLGVDAGAPAGEALEWQLMGTVPSHAGAQLADSLARVRGWTTTAAAPRAISDVFAFSQKGVPIVFPIPGRTWKGYSDETRTAAMARFDHYHQPGDEWIPGFPMTGTLQMTDWLWSIIREATDGHRSMR